MPSLTKCRILCGCGLIIMFLISGCITTQGFIDKALEHDKAVLKVLRPAYILSINGFPKNKESKVYSFNAPDCINIGFNYQEYNHSTRVTPTGNVATVSRSLVSDPQYLYFKIEKGHVYELRAGTDAKLSGYSINSNYTSMLPHKTSRPVYDEFWGSIIDTHTSQYVHKKDPSYIEIKSNDDYYCRATAYLRDKQWSESISDYSMFINTYSMDTDRSDNPLLKKAYINRGWVLSKLSRHIDAIEDYSKAIQLDPEYAMAIYYRGISYFESGEYDKALLDIERAKSLKYKVPKETISKIRKAAENMNNAN